MEASLVPVVESELRKETSVVRKRNDAEFLRWRDGRKKREKRKKQLRPSLIRRTDTHTNHMHAHKRMLTRIVTPVASRNRLLCLRTRSRSDDRINSGSKLILVVVVVTASPDPILNTVAVAGAVGLCVVCLYGCMSAEAAAAAAVRQYAVM